MMFLKPFLLISVLIWNGCVAEKLTPNQIAQAQHATSILFLHQAPPPFQVLTERNLIPIQVGLIPELIASIVRGTDTPSSLGARVHAQEKLDDPAIGVQKKLITRMQERLRVANVRSLDEVQSDIIPDRLSGSITGDLVVAVKTTTWQLMYYAMDTSFHYLRYRGEVRVLDMAKNDVIWSSACSYESEEPKNHRHTIAELVADNAKFLRIMFDNASESCAKELMENML